MTGAEAVRDALLGMEQAFADARRERMRLIREIGALEPRSAYRELLTALLRREAADADTEAPVADRVARVAAERSRAAAAVPPDARALVDAIDATYAWALERSAALADGVAGPVGDALTTYVRALTALHTDGVPALAEFEHAEAALSSHLAALP